MTWRPWIVAGLLLVAVLFNVVLITQERLPSPEGKESLTKIDEPLRHLLYKPTNRRNNFKEMGMDDDFAHAVATRIDRYAGMKAKLVDMLQQQSAEVGDAFCATAGLPQPYAAARFLMLEENGRRDVVDAARLTRFEEQPWFAKSPVQQVYSEVESVQDRHADATIMGVSALLLSREGDVLEGASPWSKSLMGTWGFSRLKRDDPKIEVMVVEYFSLMHYLTELANTSDGICS